MCMAREVGSFSFGPTVNRASPGRAGCLSDVDCDPDGASGEVCWWLYDGCSHGKCMCDPRTHAPTETGRCAVRKSPASKPHSRFCDALPCVLIGRVSYIRITLCLSLIHI